MGEEVKLGKQTWPVHEVIQVVRGVDIYKSDKWWKAALLTESHGRRQVAIYQWRKSEDKWKRKQKFSINSVKDWEETKSAVEELLQEAFGE